MPVPVPHRNSLPKTQLGHRYNIQPCEPDSDDMYALAMNNLGQEYDDYDGFPDVQAYILQKAVEALSGVREINSAPSSQLNIPRQVGHLATEYVTTHHTS